MQLTYDPRHNEQLQASDNGTLVVINEALGERREIPLTR